MNKKGDGKKIVCDNPRARFDYHLEEFLEAGLVLSGSEVKSLRTGKAHIRDSFARVFNSEIFLVNAHISPYSHAGYAQHDPTRMRKLLLKKQEIRRLIGKIEQKGYTLIPTKIYFTHGIAKVELALGKGKKTYDKRQAVRERELDREAKRAMKVRRERG